jgi:cupin 2 domain-containing protein
VTPVRGNLYTDASAPPAGERFDVLLEHRNLVVERIVSSAAVESKACVQAQDEWVVLLHGSAVLEVRGERVDLTAGDYVFLPAGAEHTVRSASDGALWLAVHLHPEAMR